jgi:hypothetical protein
MSKQFARSLLGFIALIVVLSLPQTASADRSIIKQPGDHPDYVFEAEPHLLLGFAGPGPADDGYGVGFRGTINIVDNGFIKTINNSVGIGFGLDWMVYDWDNRFCNGPRGNRICYDDDDFDDIYVIRLPIVMQWNFWLSENWSVFGEVGGALRFIDYDDDYNDAFDNDDDWDMGFDPFVFFAGGRFHFSETVSLTMRLGYPTFSIGVSFFI